MYANLGAFNGITTGPWLYTVLSNLTLRVCVCSNPVALPVDSLLVMDGIRLLVGVHYAQRAHATDLFVEGLGSPNYTALLAAAYVSAPEDS